MNFSCYCFLDDLLSLRLHLFTRSLDVSILTPIDDEKEVKIILQVFWRILTLDDLNTKKIELHTNSEDISKVKLPSLLPSAQKSHLITWNLLVLNIFYLIPIIVLPPLSDFELLRVKCSSSHFFISCTQNFISFSWLAILLILILKCTPSRDFQHKISNQWDFCRAEQKATIFLVPWSNFEINCNYS